MADAHGDVLAAFNPSRTQLANYTYDAWGNIQSQGTQTWGKENPIRYYGQYYDDESGMTYLRARYYDGDIHRFISEDPAKDGNNWYAYCGNNPVMLIDPWGLTASIDENSAQNYVSKNNVDYAHKLLEYYRQISDDIIEYDEQKNEFIITQKNEGLKPKGTGLVRAILENPEGIDIEFKYEKGSSATSVKTKEQLMDSKTITITFDPDKDYSNIEEANYVENKEGVIYLETNPTRCIPFVHELCHAYDSMAGNVTSNHSEFVTGIYYDSSGTVRVRKTLIDEIRVIGIDYLEGTKVKNNPNLYTENFIRAEIDGTRRVSVARPAP